jgi:hypothetical protein
MQSGHIALTGSWFRSRAGRRYGRDFAWLIAAKVVLLALLYFIFVAPQSRVDTSPAAIRARLTPSAERTAENHPATDPGRNPAQNSP